MVMKTVVKLDGQIRKPIMNNFMHLWTITRFCNKLLGIIEFRFGFEFDKNYYLLLDLEIFELFWFDWRIHMLDYNGFIWKSSC